jgi:Flp pilus assembly protein TadG
MRTMSKADSQERRPSEVFMFSHRTTIRDEVGQAFVELAIVLPVAILLLVGAAEIGRLAFASIEVSNAARAGVAYGAQSHITASDIVGIQTAATQDAPNVTSMTATATQSCSCNNGTTVNFVSCAAAGTSCASPNRIIESVQVTTTAPVDTVFHLPGIPNTVTLRGQATMRVQQ